MSADLVLWWFLLCAVSALNVLALSLSAVALRWRHSNLSSGVYALRRLQLFLSAGYVFGCAYRSALPVYDIQRLCLFDSWLSSVIVGRSVATFAELCFVTQWAVLLWQLSRTTGSRGGQTTALALVPLITIAETFSWYAVLTTSNAGHVLEESLWGLSAALLVTSLASIRTRCPVTLRPALTATCVAGSVYVLFMFMIDVPMYWSRWSADQMSGRAYLSLAQGVVDASGRWVVSHRLEDWKNEIAWMSLYFSVAVWLSIALIHAPLLLESGVAPNTSPRRWFGGRRNF
jgi:hypothetical protein